MMATHLIEVNDLTPTQLCHYIELKQYVPIKQMLNLLSEYSKELLYEEDSEERGQLVIMLFERLKEEMEQVMRNDQIIIFPLIGKHMEKELQTSPQMPLSMIRDKNKKIMQLLDRLRKIANNYMLKPEWKSNERLFFEELFALDQMVAQSIYLKENVLIPKIMKYND